MKNQKSKILFLFFFTDLIISLFSCRDDIYDPNRLQGNTNEPCIIRHYSSYTFILDARDFNHDLVDYTFLKEYQSYLDVEVRNYFYGYVAITISDGKVNRRYSKTFSNNVNILFDTLEGFIPERVELSFYRFTGNLRLSVYNTN